MRRKGSRETPHRVKGAKLQWFNEAKIAELECEGSERKREKKNYQDVHKKSEGGPDVYPGNKDPTNDGGCGEKLRLGEILRLEGLGR